MACIVLNASRKSKQLPIFKNLKGTQLFYGQIKRSVSSYGLQHRKEHHAAGHLFFFRE